MSGRRVVTRELLDAVNERLTPDFKGVRRAEGARTRQELGTYFLVNTQINGLLERDIDVFALADELGVTS